MKRFSKRIKENLKMLLAVEIVVFLFLLICYLVYPIYMQFEIYNWQY